MQVKSVQDNLRAPLISRLVFLLLVVLFQGCFAAVYQPMKQPSKAATGRRSSVVFQVAGNVYPKGYYQVTLTVGQPSKPYFLDIDTGSDLTWLQCDAPCTKCTPAPHSLYKPNKDLVRCRDPLCASLHWPGNHACETEEQCDYEVEYADHGSSMGVLMKDAFRLKLTSGSDVTPRLAFGCGYNQQVPNSARQPYTDGVLGLGTGKSSIVAQLSDAGLIRNVVGHCLSQKGGGYLFFGDDLIPSSGVIWKPVMRNSVDKHYSLGQADILLGGRPTGIKKLPIIFDSGSTYTYLSSDAYRSLISLLKADLNGKLKDATEDRSLPVCWKGPKPFKSVGDAKSYFKPLALSFTNGKSVQFELQPEAYLILTAHGNICSGILNGGEVGLGNFNLIGDISLLDKMVIYDNEKQQIGWVSSNCEKIPKS